MIGQTLGHYRILEKLGEGGMGVVYRAADSKLGREVAIKVLPETFARDPERLARFEREARVLASLNHPNIAAIHGLEEQDGLRYLVLEYVPGLTLAERLGDKAPGERVRAGFKPAHAPLPVDEALEIAKQIAEALEAAHEKGIIHRDLKPANVKVTPEGKVKVLDFGLAKAFEPEGSDVNLSKSPTISVAATRAGVILGTAAYMSPEQARGKAVDKRTDIWAFGCVLYEMLSGKPVFGADTITDTIAAIVKNEPDWSALPAETPAAARPLLRRCLEKDPHRRLHDMADARIELEETLQKAPGIGAGDAGVAAAAPRPAPLGFMPRKSAAMLGLGGLVMGAAAAGMVVWRLVPTPSAPAPLLTRVLLSLPPSAPLSPGIIGRALAISPDGSRLVYVGFREGSTRLFVRAMDELEPKPLAGTEGAQGPFFSPDGQWVGFFAQGKLKKVLLNGGAPVTLCDTAANTGAYWARDGTIFFAVAINSGLSRVSAEGGVPQVVTTLARDEEAHRQPHVLPGGEAVLFTVFPGRGIAVQSLKTGFRRMLIQDGVDARYAPTGHLVFARAGTLLAAPFDLKRLEVTGPAVPVADGVRMTVFRIAAHYAFSETGSLVYTSGGPGGSEDMLVWVDRKGTSRPLGTSPRSFVHPQLSPDGQKLALDIREAGGDVWIHDLVRGTLTRLTFDPGEEETPIWSPDGKRVAFTASRAGQPRSIFWKPAGGGAEELLATAPHHLHLTSWSPDGRFLLYYQMAPNTGQDIWLLPLEGDRKPRPMLQTPFNESDAKFSPDGRWVAYVSDETGRNEVYVQAYPGPGGKSQISTEGGTEPAWARSGRELFYRNGDKMMAVTLETKPGFTAGTPRLLFQGQYEPTYDVAPDGQRFLMIKAGAQGAAPVQLQLVLNWFEELKRRVPVK